MSEIKLIIKYLTMFHSDYIDASDFGKVINDILLTTNCTVVREYLRIKYNIDVFDKNSLNEFKAKYAINE